MDKRWMKVMLPIVICAVLAFIANCINNIETDKILLYDANDYWVRGIYLYSNGFSIYNIPGSGRGYVFPVYLGTLGKLWGGLKGYRIMNPIVVGCLFGYLLPRLFGSRDTKFQTLRIVSCFFLFLVLFEGVFVYPLSDVFALGLSACSVWVCNAYSENNPKWKNAVIAFACGALCYCAYNVRTIYLFAGIYVVVQLCINMVRKKESVVFKAVNLVLFCVGVVVAGVPQLLMNMRFYNESSISVPTSGLMRMQLFWGLQYQRYDTFAGHVAGMYLTEHPNPEMYFTDPVGQALIAREGITGFPTWFDYIEFLFRHPIEVSGIYIRHLVNMLLPCWPNQYVYDLDNNKIFFVIIMLLMLFLFLMVVCGKMWLNITAFKNFIPLLIPTLFILPGAVEIRFFIAFYILLIYTLGFNTDYKKVLLEIQNHKCRTLLLFLVFSGFICSIWSNLLVSETAYKMFIY